MSFPRTQRPSTGMEPRVSNLSITNPTLFATELRRRRSLQQVEQPLKRVAVREGIALVNFHS